MEAVILSVGGGLLGIALGLAASAFIAHIVHWSTDISWLAIAASFAISAAVGIVFGYYPCPAGIARHSHDLAALRIIAALPTRAAKGAHA